MEVLLSPPLTATALALGQMARVDLAIVTIAATPDWKLALPDATCGLVKWCSQAEQLAESLRPNWTVDIALLARRDEPALDECPTAVRLAWNEDLARRLLAYTQRMSSVKSLSDANAREREARWLAVCMQKLQLLARGRHAAVFFTDWDVDPAPSIAHAQWAFNHHLRAFLDDHQTVLMGTPDGAAPLNAGAFLVKPGDGHAFELALSWLRNGTDAVWEPERGYDLVGKPSTLGLPRGCGARCRRYQRTRFVRRDSWDWGAGSAADQGALFYVTHALMRGYAIASLGSNYSVHHHHGTPKPWESSDRQTMLLQLPWYRDLSLDGADSRRPRAVDAPKSAPPAGQPTAELRGRAHRKMTRCARVLAERRAEVLAFHSAPRAEVAAWLEKRRLRLRTYRAQPLFGL